MYASFSGSKSLSKLARLLRALTFLLPVLLATGCSTSFSPANAPYTNTSPGGISGNVHGGRQPIVGAQIYLLAAGTGGNAGPSIAASATNLSKSLLISSKASGYQTTKNTTGSASTNPLYGDYYVSTDSTGSFAVSGEYTCTQGTQVYLYSVGGVTGGNTTANTAAGLMAVLGECPSSGTFVGDINYVYMNEISTVAAAYAIAGYASDAVHVSSSNHALAEAGIANAFANAANLYDVTARTAGLVANTEPLGKNGTVPQTTIHALANSLAACVNSTSASSAQCGTNLFDEVESAGTTGTVATDTATEAIYIAQNAGTAVTTVFNNASSIGTPWEPTLSTAPTDWTLPILFTGGGLKAPQNIAIDASGNVWVTNLGNNSLSGFSPLGEAISGASGYTGGGLGSPYGIAVDASGYVWVANATSVVSRFYGSNAVTPNAPGDAFYASGCTNSLLRNSSRVVVTVTGTVWANSLNKNLEFSAGTTSCTLIGQDAGGEGAGGMAIDANQTLWISDQSGNNDQVVEVPFGGSSPFADFKFTQGGIGGPDGIAADASGNIWVANGSGGANLSKLYGSNPPNGHNTGDAFATSGYSGGGLGENDGLAIDGAGRVWVAVYANASETKTSNVSVFSNSGTAITGSFGYASAFSSAPTDVVIDGSGNVWVVNTANNTVMELVGAASPVVTPVVANLLSPYGTAAVNRP